MRCGRQPELTGHRGRSGDRFYAARHDLLRARENLTDAARRRLEAAFRADPWDELECAWTLKEMLRAFYRSADRAAAETALVAWHRCAGDYDIAETNRLAHTLRAWQPELLAYFDTRLTNGPTEGVNRIIKAVKRQGFAYTNTDNYRLRVLHRCTRHTEPARQPNPRSPTKTWQCRRTNVVELEGAERGQREDDRSVT